MRKITILLGLVVVLSGCASVSLNPDTGIVSYLRFGTQETRGFEAKRTPNGGLSVKMEGQNSGAEGLTEAVRAVMAITAMGGK